MKRLHVATIVVLLVSVSLAGCTGGLPAADTPQDDSVDQPTPPAEGTLQVHYIAVGQAAGVLVIGPEGGTMIGSGACYWNSAVKPLEQFALHARFESVARLLKRVIG